MGNWFSSPKREDEFTKEKTKEKSTTWRNVPGKNFYQASQNLRRKIANSPRTNIYLMGHTGAGKSSFLNSVKSSFAERIANLQNVRKGDFGGPCTKQFRSFDICGIQVFDTAGFADAIRDGPDSKYMKALFEGRAALRKMFNSECLTEVDWEIKPHCIIFVIAADALSTTEAPVEGMKILQAMLPEECAAILLITKIDMICEETNNDVKKLYSSEKVHKIVRMAAVKFGLEEHAIFPVVNFKKEYNIQQTVPILHAFSRAADFASDRL